MLVYLTIFAWLKSRSAKIYSGVGAPVGAGVGAREGLGVGAGVGATAFAPVTRLRNIARRSQQLFLGASLWRVNFVVAILATLGARS